MRTKPDHGEESYVGKGLLSGLATLITGGDSGIGRAVDEQLLLPMPGRARTSPSPTWRTSKQTRRRRNAGWRRRDDAACCSQATSVTRPGTTLRFRAPRPRRGNFRTIGEARAQAHRKGVADHCHSTSATVRWQVARKRGRDQHPPTCAVGEL